MKTPTILAIHIAPAAGEPLRAVPSINAVPGRGLEGDRYYNQTAGRAAPRKPIKPDQQLTLIEVEALNALRDDYGIELSPAECRRNLLTRGIALNHLVGREFTVGGVRARGIKLCEPCGYLEKVTGKTVRPGLIHRGGLRAEILTAGEIRVGDPIAVVDHDASTAATATAHPPESIACA